MNKKNIQNKNDHPAPAKVYLVGAGPGDPGLITVRAKELLACADVVVYDHLAASELLDETRPSAERIYVGKRGNCHSMPQSQIEKLLIEKAKKGNTVVRLKGGDPFVFGRGGEEAEALVQAGIHFEIVPGISAGIAAPAYAGIPVTDRRYASQLALITGHQQEAEEDSDRIDWENLAHWAGTSVFYMGVGHLKEICQRLQSHGMPPEKPAAIIQWGCTSKQKTITGTVNDLPEKADHAAITPPAVIVIGDVVRLREKLKWFEKQPLFGKTIVVTRATPQASPLANQLRRAGADVLLSPAIQIESADPKPLADRIQRIKDYDWLVFTSANGVNAFFEVLTGTGKDSRWLADTRICAIGPATACALHNQGIKPDAIPPRYLTEAIAETLQSKGSLKDKKILLPRADTASEELERLLREQGAQVHEVTAYHVRPAQDDKTEIREALEKKKVHWITFASSMTARFFLEKVGPDRVIQSHAKIASIGPVTSATIKKMGLNVDSQAQEYTAEMLVQAICHAEKENPPGEQ